MLPWNWSLLIFLLKCFILLKIFYLKTLKILQWRSIPPETTSDFAPRSIIKYISLYHWNYLGLLNYKKIKQCVLLFIVAYFIIIITQLYCLDMVVVVVILTTLSALSNPFIDNSLSAARIPSNTDAIKQ